MYYVIYNFNLTNIILSVNEVNKFNATDFCESCPVVIEFANFKKQSELDNLVSLVSI